ncbi:hypothetical protein GOB12_02320 [Sinorhizobium meliloti]|nr:hypothetical protein [Sinorhizobium meliloti]MDX0392070.1 hypothetical protein [Sinorhizobium meliloti]
MSNERYSTEQMTQNAEHAYKTPPTAEELGFMSMSPDQRRDYISRMEHAAAKATHDTKVAALQEQVRKATEVSLQGNQWYQMQQRGQLSQRVSVSDGQTTTENLRATPNASSNAYTAPKALVDQLPVTVGGIQLGPDQAKEMLARGEISARDYQSAVNEALKPYGYSAPSFR